MKKNTYVITVARQFGSLGRPIAKMVAEKLGIDYYDRDLVDQAAEKLKLPASTISMNEESAKASKGNPFLAMAYPFGQGVSGESVSKSSKSTNIQDKIFEAQKNIIHFLAEKDSCVIVGRCSDFILSDMENAIHIYIYAPYEKRLKNSVEELHLGEEEAKKMISEVDSAREAYHLHYAGYKPDDFRFKDLMIDSSLLGPEGTAELIADIARKKLNVSKEEE